MAVITRRKFIRDGSKWIAVASIPAILHLDPTKVFAGPKADASMAEYFDLFQVDDEIIKKTITAALSHGGDFCDLYFEHRISNWVGLQDDAVNKAYCDIEYGVGIRVVKGDQTGYSFTEEISPEAMMNAAKTASNIADLTKITPPPGIKNEDSPQLLPD